MPVRYTFDEWNRLIVAGPADALRPRRIVEGRVRTDARNRLVYEFDAASAPDGAAAARRVVLDGTWRLSPDHEIALSTHGTQGNGRQTLWLKGALARAEADSLVVALRQQRRGARAASREISLSGRWEADARNRLNFLVARGGSEDRLTLLGRWEIGPRHELQYRYRQPGASPAQRTLAFRGSWDVTAANRLAYRLAGSSDSVFEFSGSLRTPSLLAREGRLVYELGAGVTQGKRRRRIELFGTWKLHRDLSVTFEVPYADGRVEAIRFQGTAQLGPRRRIAVELSTRRGEPLGVSVLFTKPLVRDASLFLRLRRDAEEMSAIGGVQVRF